MRKASRTKLKELSYQDRIRHGTGGSKLETEAERVIQFSQQY